MLSEGSAAAAVSTAEPCAAACSELHIWDTSHEVRLQSFTGVFERPQPASGTGVKYSTAAATCQCVLVLCHR